MNQRETWENVSSKGGSPQTWRTHPAQMHNPILDLWNILLRVKGCRKPAHTMPLLLGVPQWLSIPSSLAQESFVFCWYGRNCNQQTGQFLYRLKFSNRKSIFQESPTILRLVFYTEIKSFSDTADFFIDSSYEITMKYVQTYVHTHKIWRYDIDYRCAFKMETWLETNWAQQGQVLISDAC